MKKLFILTILGLIVSLSSFALVPLTGTMGACVGSSTYIYEMDSSATGVWSSSNPTVATVGASTGVSTGSGIVTGVTAGVATITYSAGGAIVTSTFTVTPAPAAITGTTPACVGSSTTLSDATPGGSWSSTSPGVAAVDAMTGVVTGIGGGSASILYTTGTGCSSSIGVTIATITLSDSITGPDAVCVGSTITLSSITPGGTWSSSIPAIATVGASGVVAGVTAGTAIISYTVSSVCAGSASAYKYITVNTTASVGAISGTTSINVGAATTLTDGSAGGTWSSSNTAVATVNATTGSVTGVAAGTATITYTISICGATPYVTTTVSVAPFSGISGHVNLTGAFYYGSVRVWLITYNPATLMLEATDSVTLASSSSVYYQFSGLATDSFRVKAALVSADTLVWGFVPTYHTSAFYWHDANVIYHTSGAADINEDISMATGTPVTGPGFIGGSVMSGANKGTLTTEPAVGMVIFLQNSATGALVKQTVTDASGNYSFGSLPYGTYFVYPELINYATTPYTSITLSASTPVVHSAGFMQHTLSKTITPVGEAVGNIQAFVSSVTVYPNPANGKLNILWNTAENETGNVSITDIAGREVYSATINMNAGTGISQADISGLTNGLYLISVKSANISYNNKIEVLH